MLPDALQDLHGNSSFNFLVGIGVQEHPLFPALSFQELCFFKEEGPLIWKKLLDVLIQNHKRLSQEEGEKAGTHTRFYNSLIKSSLPGACSFLLGFS